MADILIRRAHEGVSQDPTRIMDSRMEGVPEGWRQSIQLDRPLEGVNICTMNGRPSSNWAFEAEGGPGLTMSILLDGTMEAGIADGTDFRLGAGHVLMMAVGEHVSGWDVFSTDRDFRMVNINLTQQALLGMTGLQMKDLLKCMRSSTCAMTNVDVCMASMPVFSMLQRVAGEISHCRYPDCRARNVFLCAKVAEALAAIPGKCTQELGTIPSPRAIPSDRPRLVQARTLLETRCSEAWRVQSIAQAVGLNEKRLQAGFQAMYNCTVHECLTRIRLDMALSMLTSGSSVTHTALAVGFANVSHFSKVFRNSLGMSPKQWTHGHQSAD